MYGQLLQLLAKRAEAGKPLRVGLIGAGKFGTMFLSQVQRVPGLHLLGVADLSPHRAAEALTRAGFTPDRFGMRPFSSVLRDGSTAIVESGAELIAADGLDVVVEATGIPAAGIRHALDAIAHGVHIVMVNVEADVLAGPLLADRARAAGVTYSLAYGDQPALICELVDWARCAGFEVVCAGKGTKYLPVYHGSTPDTVWGYYGFSPEMVASGDYNARMFNSFLDGTKSAIEMAAVANATGLLPQDEGLRFPPCGVDDLPRVLRPCEAGGQLSRRGTVEVVSSLERDGRPVFRDLRWGVYVTLAAPSEYVKRCFAEYGLVTDPSGAYTALYRPFHLIGLELAISVLGAGLRGEATGSPSGFRAGVVAVAKRDLTAGETLDGEGGFTVYGALRPAERAIAEGGLPIGLAHGVRLTRAVAAGQPVRWQDVAIDEADETVQTRRAMEAQFAPANVGT